tara:strand:+ start:780 stop:1049 length:270 start_codon:yes stop_codon:yes gene_type:complete
MFIRQNKDTSIKKWLKSPIETANGVIYDNHRCQPSLKPITHQNFINSVYNDITKIINRDGYRFTDSKQFKKELTYIIYSLSDNSVYGPL